MPRTASDLAAEDRSAWISGGRRLLQMINELADGAMNPMGPLAQ